MCIGGLCCGLLTGDLVLGVLLAVLALAVGSAGLGYVDLKVDCQHTCCPQYQQYPSTMCLTRHDAARAGEASIANSGYVAGAEAIAKVSSDQS